MTFQSWKGDLLALSHPMFYRFNVAMTFQSWKGDGRGGHRAVDIASMWP